MYNKNRNQQNDRMNSSSQNQSQGQDSFNRPAGRFNRSNHDTTGYQNFGQDQQAQRQQSFSGGSQSYGQNDMSSRQQGSQWQQHEGPSYTAYGSNGGVYDTTSSNMGRGDANGYGTSATGYGSSSGAGYGQGQHSDWSRAGSDRMGSDFSERQGMHHPTRSMNEGMYKSDSYSSSGMPQSSEQIGSRYYSGDQSGQQYGGMRSQYGTFGSGTNTYGTSYGASQGSYGAGQNYGSQNSYGAGSQSYGQPSYGSNQSSQSTTGVWGAPNTQSLYGEHHGKGPKSYRRSDDRVREDVCEALAHHGGIDASEIDVTVAEGVVTLAGTIDSRQMKRMVEEAIEHMSGVQDIKNELKVEESNMSSSRRSSSSDMSSTEGSRSLSGSSSSMNGKTASSTAGRTSTSSTSATTKQ